MAGPFAQRWNFGRMKTQDKDAQRSGEALRAYTPEFVADMLQLNSKSRG